MRDCKLDIWWFGDGEQMNMNAHLIGNAMVNGVYLNAVNRLFVLCRVLMSGVRSDGSDPCLIG